MRHFWVIFKHCVFVCTFKYEFEFRILSIFGHLSFKKINDFLVIFQPLWILESSIYVKGVSKAGLVTALEQGKWKFKNAFSVWVEPLLRRRQRNAQFMGGKNKKLRCLWHEKKMFEIQFRMTCILILGLFSEGSWQQLILLYSLT